MLDQLVNVVKPATLTLTMRLQGCHQQRLGGIKVLISLPLVHSPNKPTIRYRNITVSAERHCPVEDTWAYS